MLAAQIKRSFAIRNKPVTQRKACMSLIKLSTFAHEQFVQNYEQLFAEIPQSPVSYQLKLLETSISLAGKKKHQSTVDHKLLTERVFLQLIEDLDDPLVTSQQDILDIMDFLSRNAIEIDEMQSLVQDVLHELERRAHLFLSQEIKNVSAQVQKMIMMRVIDPVPRVDQSVRDLLKVTDINQLIRQKHFPTLDGDMHYDRKKERVTVRTADHRFVFQQIQKNNGDSLQVVLDTLQHEKCDLVMLTMAPFSQSERVYYDPTEIDEAMFNRFKGKKHFKVGQTERLVYEKVAGMKRVNMLQSIMYNFSSEGAFFESEKPVALLGPDPNSVYIENVTEVTQNIRMQLLLEKLSWTADCLDVQGCPQCSTKQTESCDGITPAYLDHLSSKLWRDTRTDLMAQNLNEIIEDNDDIEKIVIFSHTPVLDLASKSFSQNLIQPAKNKQEDYYKARVLMDDLDLEMTNPLLQNEWKSLHPTWPYEPQSRDCFIESQLIIN